MTTRSHAFSRALCQLHEFTTSFDWFIGLSASVGIRHSDDFGIGLRPYLKPAQFFGSFLQASWSSSAVHCHLM